MSNFVRRIVSANKSRFKDEELKLELDLVYVTDRIIIMGYPATGIEGLYRNRREDAIRFLQHRHGQDYWVFNFCPLKENSYDPAIFEGRVSRYPFPDHHAPPLAILPLATREIDAWLGGSEDRVAVLHCKAGKGRSGTMACAYLLAHERIPSPPRLQRSYSTKEQVERQIQDTINILPLNDGESTPVSSPVPSPIATPHPSVSAGFPDSLLDAKEPLGIEKSVLPQSSPLKPVANNETTFTDALKAVLDLHTVRRMKISGDDPRTNEKQKKQGVSIPSQRRFLYYWALVLAQEAPKYFWPVERLKDNNGGPSFRRLRLLQTKVRLTKIKLRMRDSYKVAVGVVKAANTVIGKTDKSRSSSVEPNGMKEKEKAWGSSSQIWASLARYDDDLVDLLEEWEVHTRGISGNVARRRPESITMDQDGLSKSLDEIFHDGKWDKQKMVRSFAKLGVINGGKKEKDVDSKDDKIRLYTLTPFATNGTQKQGVCVENNQKIRKGTNDNHGTQNDLLPSDESPPSPKCYPHVGVIELDAWREVRLKLYMGQVFMGWAWFIPAFHMSQSPPSRSEFTEPPTSSLKTVFLLQRDDIDFPLGVGKAIIDVEIEMEWFIPLQ